MAEFSSHVPGTFSWVDLATTDQKAGVAFYRALFGWDVNEQPMGPGEIYSMFTMRGKEVAAASTMRGPERQSGVPPHWNIYVTVASADAAASRAQSLGGKVLAPPFDVMDAGRMAVLQDPTGAVINVWEAKRQHRREDPERAGRALLERAHDPRSEGGRGVLREALRLDGEAQLAERRDGVHRDSQPGPAGRRDHGHAAGDAGWHAVLLDAVFPGRGLRRDDRKGEDASARTSWCRRTTSRTPAGSRSSGSAGGDVRGAFRSDGRVGPAARLGDPRVARPCHDGRMTTELLTTFSNALADAVAAAAPGVVQVQGRRRPASGLVYADDIVRDDGARARPRGRLHVRRHDGQTLDAELVGWDPTTGLAVLRVDGLETSPLIALPPRPRASVTSRSPSRGHGATPSPRAPASSRSSADRWPTGRRRAIDQVLRTTAPMHDGFAGGAFVDTTGALLGVTTAAAIRGLGVVIPASIAWKTAASVLEHGGLKRGYLGIAGQPVAARRTHQRDAIGRDEALLVVGVTGRQPGGRGRACSSATCCSNSTDTPIGSPEDLLDLLVGDRVGRQATLRVLRGGAATDVAVTIGERPAD